jgi:hypothetical protein
MQETKPQYNLSLGYAKTMFRQFPVFTVLPNLGKQISLICLLSILKISQPKHGFRFILVILYFQGCGQNFVRKVYTETVDGA